ncbi:DEAD/DEAH box helicase [Thalassotalea sp. M1531]|uniref:DEAD-box ATP-dependent RNA helicase RhpA n=1 Tax=Thalassotalea algicola TaxID=2716224 RepID=A0A7Y0LD41_9GAMM|nr:DEAD/DEAH box helicase [Thalassotalea algicola]NMP30955.1 DEAD/DEAH box helicase [Thalassotalea algicola]
MLFSDLGLAPQLLKAIEEQGYSSPSPIQEQAIPAVLKGRDVMAAAQTGTGKTAGFTLPILQQLSDSKKRASSNCIKTLILTPTRELAAQVAKSVEVYSQHLDISSDVVFGGVKINPQMMRLRKGVDILVATPGRLLDLYQQNALKFNEIEMLVLDEADRMLDMGFIRDIKKILALLPKKRQNLLFSATFSPEIRELAKDLVHKPIEISVNPENSTASTIEHWLVAVDKRKKSALLNKLIVDNSWQQVLVFARTKHGANRLTRYLEAEGHKAAAIHGNKSQSARTKALAQFKDKTIHILVATDIAARGIDISQLPIVVNFDLPNVQEDYVHRIGRTGRAGVDGQAISLVCADEYKQLVDIEYIIQQHIPRKEVEGFIPANPLEPSRSIRPLKAKKPKKPKKQKEHQDGQRSGENARGHKPKSKNPRHQSNKSNRTDKSGNVPRKGRGGKPSSNNSNNNRRRPANK